MTTWKPAFVRLGMTAGTSATRRSPGKLSRGTPMTIHTMVLAWLGGRDSNPDTQIQSLQSYR
jgi:hypothetical protein